jgi:hypothetical protein
MEQRYHAVMEVISGAPVTGRSAELAEMLQFLIQHWLTRDPARLGASLEEFVGHPAYGPAQLRSLLRTQAAHPVRTLPAEPPHGSPDHRCRARRVTGMLEAGGDEAQLERWWGKYISIRSPHSLHTAGIYRW